MEITVLQHSEVLRGNIIYRIDAEYFRKEYLDAVKLVESKQYSYIEDVTSWVTQGPNPRFSEMGIPCLTGRNINKGEVSYDNPDFVDEAEYKKLSRYKLKVGDTLITLKGKGSIGKVGFVTQDRRAIFSRDIGIIRPSLINPGYLNVFILCKFGKLLVERGETGGTGQSTLTTSYLKAIPVPRFSFENDIGILLEKVESLKEKSKKKYNQAKSILLSELGLSNWQPRHRLTFVKNFSDTQQPGRIDAEYYKPKYDELFKIITQNSEYVKRISEFQTYNARGLQPKYSIDGSIDVVTSKHILENGLDYDNFDKTDSVNWNLQKKAHIEKGSILTYTTGANIGRTAIYQSDRKALASNHVNILRVEGENPEYVAFVMNSLVGRLQTERLSAGSAQAELYPKDIENFIIPFVQREKQYEIQQKVTESLSLRKQSKHLLECAKKAVEIAIEQDEEKATKWLQLFENNEKTEQCN